MAQLPVNRTTSNTPADHIADHNEIHRLHDILDGSAGPSQALATLDGRYVPQTQTQAVDGTSVPVFAVQPHRSGSAAFDIVEQSGLFSTFWDPVMMVGYNTGKVVSGHPSVAAEPAWLMGLETNYWQGTNFTCEWYVQYSSPDMSIPQFRPFFCAVGRDNNASHWAQIFMDVGTDVAARSQWTLMAGATVLTQFTAASAQFNSPQVNFGTGGADVNVTINGLGSSVLAWSVAGVNKWQQYTVGAAMFFRDLVNARQHITYTAGASSTAAYAQLFCNLQVYGGVGFYGHAANGAQAAAIATPNAQTASYVQADVTSLKTAIDAIRVALQNVGLTL